MAGPGCKAIPRRFAPASLGSREGSESAKRTSGALRSAFIPIFRVPVKVRDGENEDFLAFDLVDQPYGNRRVLHLRVFALRGGHAAGKRSIRSSAERTSARKTSPRPGDSPS